MSIITREDFFGEKKKCSYVLAYFRNHNLNIGDEWNAGDYIMWIRNKHQEFHKIHKLPEYVTYWNGHNEDLLEEFLKFIGFVPSEITIDFGNLLEEINNKKVSLCLIDSKPGWFIVDSQNRLYQIDDYYCGGFLDRFIRNKLSIVFELISESISDNIKDKEKDIWDFDSVKKFMERQALV